MIRQRAQVVGCLFTAHLVFAACGDRSNFPVDERASSGGAGGSVNTTSSATSDASSVASTSSVGSASGGGAGLGGASDPGGASGTGGSAGTGTGGASGAGSAGIVYFSNDGTIVGWSSARPQSNTIGKVVD